MANLAYLNLSDFINTYSISVFFETGSGGGDGIRAALKYNFKRIISVEIMEKQVEILKKEFANEPRVEIYCGSSLEILEQLLPTLQDENIMFWLDAHYPGADIHISESARFKGIDCDRKDNDFDDSLRLPMHHELDLIKKLRPNRRDVIMADDLSIYCNASQLDKQFQPKNSDFKEGYFLDAFKETHRVTTVTMGFNPPLGAPDVIGILVPI